MEKQRGITFNGGRVNETVAGAFLGELQGRCVQTAAAVQVFGNHDIM
jgi:hypothetical protein